MPDRDRRLVVCSDYVWARFFRWGEAHEIQRYRGRLTVEYILAAMLDSLEYYEEKAR